MAAAGLMSVLVATCASGDQLVILGGQAKDGTFQGFDGGKILFQPSKGRFMKEQPSRISKLVLTTPTKASYKTSDGKTEEGVIFKGYEKGKFIFVKDGKEVPVTALKMKSIEPVFQTGGGGGEGGGEYPIPPVDVASLGDNLTEGQKAIIDRFNTAKKSFDEFLAVSVGMVKEMDTLKGAKREEVMNDLRRRKEAEQPLKRALVESYKELIGAFSEGEEEAAPAQPKPSTRAVGGLRSLSK